MVQGEAKLFVGQIHYEADEETLAELFGTYGNVVQMNILRDANGRSKGSAFITFGSTEEADVAVASLHDVYYMNRDKPIQVSYCQRTQNISDYGLWHAKVVSQKNQSNPQPKI